MSAVIASGRPAVQYGGPPSNRMAGRAQARAAAAKPKGNYTPKKKPQISAATVERANQFLDGEADIDQAIHQGIISANMAAHFRALMKADAHGTRAYLEKIGLNRTATAVSPPAASESEDYLAGTLSSAERSRITAAREGRQSTQIVHGGL